MPPRILLRATPTMPKPLNRARASQEAGKYGVVVALGLATSFRFLATIPLPASAWMGIVLLGATGTMSVARKRLCAA